jgi:DNA invertase Pin-like site-specific DNA recombinase
MKHHIYGYARVSTREQAISPTVQAERIEAKATELAAAGELEFACCCTDDGFSANKVAFEDRPGYSELLREMQPGDHLIVWRLDRIDRNPFRLIRAVEQLISRNITIHSLEEKGGLALDLDTVQGRAMVMIWAIMADLFTQQLSESIRSAIAWRKANGLVYYGQPSYGRRRIRLPKRPGERKGRLVDVWDEKEMAQIREIKRRHDEGESIQSIGADFHRRNETTANNEPWVKRYTKGVSRTKGHLNVQRLYRALHWYNNVLFEGKDLGEMTAAGVGPES